MIHVCTDCAVSWMDFGDPSTCWSCHRTTTGFRDLHAPVRRPPPDPLQPHRQETTR